MQALKPLTSWEAALMFDNRKIPLFQYLKDAYFN